MTTDYQWIFIAGIIGFGSLLAVTTVIYLIALFWLKRKVFHSSFATTMAQCFAMLLAYIIPLHLSWVPFKRGGDNVEVPIGRDILEAVSLLAVAMFVSFWSKAEKYHVRVFHGMTLAGCASLAITNYLSNFYNIILMAASLTLLCISCALLYYMSPESHSWGPTVVLVMYCCYGILLNLIKVFSWSIFEVWDDSPDRRTSEIIYLVTDWLATALLAIVMFLVAHTTFFARAYSITSRRRSQ